MHVIEVNQTFFRVSSLAQGISHRLEVSKNVQQHTDNESEFEMRCRACRKEIPSVRLSDTRAVDESEHSRRCLRESSYI